MKKHNLFLSLIFASSLAMAAGTATTVLHGSTTGNGIYGPVVLTTDVSGALPLANVATQAANTVLGNATAGTAAPAALAVPSCSAASSALTWTSNTGFGCNTISSGGVPGGISGDIQFNNAGAFGGTTPLGTGSVIKSNGTINSTAAQTYTLPTTTATIARTDAAQTFTGTQTFGAIIGTTFNGNTLTAGSSTYTGTAAQTYTFPTTSASVARTDAAQTFTGVQTFSSATNPTAGETGVSTNSNAAAGIIGEYIESKLAPASAVSITSGASSTTITSVSLTAGDWDCDGAVGASVNSATLVQFIQAGTNTSAALPSASDALGRVELSYGSTGQALVTDTRFVVPTYRYSLSGTTTIFLQLGATFTVNVMTGYGGLRCRRVR